MTWVTQLVMGVLGLARSRAVVLLAPARDPVRRAITLTVTRASRIAQARGWMVLTACGILLGVWYEGRTSAIESLLLSSWASRLNYDVRPGPSGRIVFPRSGPMDLERGYGRLPELTRRLESRGFELTEQARFSPALAMAARLGVSPPYREPAVAGLVIRGAGDDPLFDATSRARNFSRYEDVPPIVIRTLVFMENRQLEGSFDPRRNPAVDWGRLGKASLSYAGNLVGLGARVEGGSTLAVQIEKYRHSEGGETGSPVDKLRQVASASLRVYRDGRDTRESRREIMLDYLNSMPLAAAPGKGEIHGLGQGLQAWFDLEPASVWRALERDGGGPDQARAMKHVLALLYSVRAPTRFLVNDRAGLESGVDVYTELLARRGVIDAALAKDMKRVPIRFAPASAAVTPFVERKPAYRVRGEVASLLGIRDLYALDRMHLDVQTTLDVPLERDALGLFRSLADSVFVRRHGLRGEHLLSQGDPARVIYSLALYESTPEGNLERVRADNLAQPFDVNGGAKMELGSTAKLRTLAHYLEIMATLHAELSRLEPDALEARARHAHDRLTAWAAATLVREPGLGMTAFLERALDRTYSASPYETFFTGGGSMNFSNFDPQDNGRVLSVREATARSTNLVFIRLMRDLVRYHAARLPYDALSVLSDPDDPVRRRMLGEVADAEARQVLGRAWRDLRSVPPASVVSHLLGSRAQSPPALAALYFAWHPGVRSGSLPRWLADQGVSVEPGELERLERVFGNPRFTLLDYAYLLDRQPLAIWCAGERMRRPAATWEYVVARSVEARRISTSWLFLARHRRAQDLRLRTRIEQDAFASMTPSWRHLGFPFPRLVPSYATAIGSSSDRPVALAELMGIIVNDGIRRDAVRVRGLRFGDGTPYSSAFEAAPASSQRVLAAPVARALRGVLAGVVEHGTARRLNGVFLDANGAPITAGGKTGSGDNRFDTFGRGGVLRASRPVSRTAAFAFYLGDRYYGVITASVNGPEAGNYRFTSALPLAVLRLLAPSINRRLEVPVPRADV